MTDSGADTHEFGAAIRAAAQTVEAPHALRMQIEQQRATTARRPPVRRPLLAFAGAGVAAIVVALVLALGGSSAPTVGQAASASLRPASGPAPAEASGRLLKAGVDDVRFPQWEYALHWYPSGTRHDELGGDRRSTTVFYDARGVRIGYTIVSGAALDVPKGARTVTRGGVAYAVLRQDGATVVTWRRKGHTCVLAGRGVPAARMVSLAAWDSGPSAA